jgi:hypothetical protein
LDAAKTRIKELEQQLNLRGPGAAQVTELKAEIASLKYTIALKDQELSILRAGLKSQSIFAGRPAVTQPASVTQSLETMTASELSAAIGAANRAGDHDRVKVLYRELSARKAGKPTLQVSAVASNMSTRELTCAIDRETDEETRGMLYRILEDRRSGK